MTPSSLEPTPAGGFPFLVCPHCGGALPRVAFPPASKVAQVALPPLEPVAPELADLTPLTVQQVDRRTAETERMVNDEQPRD